MCAALDGPLLRVNITAMLVVRSCFGTYAIKLNVNESPAAFPVLPVVK